MRPASWLFLALIVLTAARMILGAFTELSGDESYYFLWQEHLDWSYYSKGPGVASVIWFSTNIFGDSAFGVRVLSPLFGLGTSWLLFILARQLLNERVAIGTVVMLNLTPIFNAGSIVLTIDPIMIFFWVAAMLTTWRAVQDEGAKLSPWWLLTGLLIGLGFLAKYTALIQLASILLFLIVWPRGRPQLRKSGFYAMLGVVVVSMTPVLIWNAQNCWITVDHLFKHLGIDLNFCADEETVNAQAETKEGGGFKLGPDIFVYLGYHLAVYSPLIFSGMFVATVIACRRFRKADPPELFLACFSLPIILLYGLISVFKMGEVNWTAPGFFGIGILFLKYFSDWQPKRVSKRKLATAAAGLGALMTILVVNSDIVRATGVPWPYEADPGGRLRGWKTLAERFDEHARKMAEEDGQDPFLIASRYQTAAGPAFYLPDDVPAFQPTAEHPVIHMVASKDGSVHNQFAFWPGYKDNAFNGRNALLIFDQPNRNTPPSQLQEAFESWALIDAFVIKRRGDDLHTWKIFACYGFKNPDESARVRQPESE